MGPDGGLGVAAVARAARLMDGTADFRGMCRSLGSAQRAILAHLLRASEDLERAADAHRVFESRAASGKLILAI